MLVKYDELTTAALAEIIGKNLHYQHHLAGDYHLRITDVTYKGDGIIEVHLRFVTGEASMPVFDAVEALRFAMAVILERPFLSTSEYASSIEQAMLNNKKNFQKK